MPEVGRNESSAVAVDVRILGPVEVVIDGRSIELGGSHPRAIIAHLALDIGRVVPVERLVSRLWGEAPPTSPLSSLQSMLSRLRRVLEPHRAPGQASTVIVSEAPGYVLKLPRHAMDLTRFRDFANEGRRAASTASHREALERFDAALDVWRGTALGGIGPDDVVVPIALALEEERLALVEDRFDTLLALGLHSEAVGELSIAVAEHRLRERLWSTLAVALYRSQRQADALRAIEQARRLLIDELGLDPGPELRELERKILDQDPSLLAIPSATAPAPELVASTAATASRFVGREADWLRLLGALARADRGEPAVVLLEGEAGIGKSSIAERLLDTAAKGGWNVAVGRCVDGDLAPALWPIVEVVRDIDGDGQMGERDQAGEGGDRTPVEIADDVLDAVDKSGPRAPWCIFFDDLHWSDRLTLEVLVLMCERLRARRVLVIGAFRSVTTVPNSALRDMIGNLTRVHGSERLVLTPLNERDTAEIMRRTAGVEPDPDAVRTVHQRAGGNPFFVGELARLFGERGVVASEDVPDAVRDVIRARLAPLPLTTNSVLQVAAVVGERLDVAVVIAASGLDDESCLDALDPAIVTRILVPGADRGLRFAHALIRDAVLADIGPLHLARLHRSVADAIERTRGTGVDAIETIARHRLASLPAGDPLRTAQQLVEASVVARWRGAFDTADELADHAIELVRVLPRDAEVDTVELRALEGTIVSMGRRFGGPAGRTMGDRVDSLVRRTDSDAARVLALYVRWWDIDEDPVANSAHLAEMALAIAQRSDNAFARTLGYHVAGFQAYQEGRIDDASRWLEAGLAATGVTRPGDDPGYVPTVHLPAIAGIVAQLRGDDAAADSHIHERYIAWFRVRGTVDPTTSLDIGFTIGLVAAMRGDPAATRQALVGVDFSNPPRWTAHFGRGCEVLEAWAAAMLGDGDGARRALVAMERLDEVTTMLARSCLRTFAAEALLQVGDAAAIAVLELARREAVERGEVWWLAETLRLGAVAESRFGDPERASAFLAEARTLAKEQGAQLLVDRLCADIT